jgi:addiction module HigA family antidote
MEMAMQAEVRRLELSLTALRALDHHRRYVFALVGNVFNELTLLKLDVSRVALSRVLNGRAAISPEMALRIEAWLGVERGGEARLWLAEQSAYDVWQARLRFEESPMHVQPAPAVPV